MSGDVMSFPDNWWTFVQDYQFADKEEIYTNGSMLIPSFRMRQMVEHYFGGNVGKTSRYSELFGTPDRAARTLTHNAPSTCDECVLIDMCDIGMPATCMVDDYDALLEWLRGEGE